jgi:hypothetical protein
MAADASGSKQQQKSLLCWSALKMSTLPGRSGECGRKSIAKHAQQQHYAGMAILLTLCVQVRAQSAV